MTGYATADRTGLSISGASLGLAFVGIGRELLARPWRLPRGSVVAMHFTEYDTRLAAYAVIVNDAAEILLTWYNGEGVTVPSWTMPGGGVEFDESIVDAVVREVYEETGFHIEVGSFLGEHHFTGPRSSRSLRPFRSQRFLYSATIVGGELGTTEVGGSTDLACWVPLADVPNLDAVRADIVDLAVSLISRRETVSGDEMK